jgi:hypothetical protein
MDRVVQIDGSVHREPLFVEQKLEILKDIVEQNRLIVEALSVPGAVMLFDHENQEAKRDQFTPRDQPIH